MEPASSGSARSAPWKKSHIAEKCSSNANGTACYPCSRSGTELKHFGESRGEELLTSFRAVFLASHFPLPASEKGRTTRGTSGRKQSESSKKSDLNTVSLKMSLDLFDPVILDISSKTLPKQGMMRNGVCSDAMILEGRTEGNVSGFWPTPRARDHKGSDPLDRKPKCDDSLPTRIERMKWPTPTESDGKGGVGGKRGGGPNLRTAVTEWATPTRRDYRSGKGRTQKQRGRKNGMSLPEQIESHGGTKTQQTFPTPHGFSKDGKSNGPSGNELGRAVNAIDRKGKGSLNPAWVSWLMGFPLKWVSLEPMEEDIFQGWKKAFQTEWKN